MQAGPGSRGLSAVRQWLALLRGWRVRRCVLSSRPLCESELVCDLEAAEWSHPPTYLTPPGAACSPPLLEASALPAPSWQVAPPGPLTHWRWPSGAKEQDGHCLRSQGRWRSEPAACVQGRRGLRAARWPGRFAAPCCTGPGILALPGGAALAEGTCADDSGKMWSTGVAPVGLSSEKQER